MVILGMARARAHVVAEAMMTDCDIHEFLTGWGKRMIADAMPGDILDTMRRADQFMAALPSILGPVYRCVIDFGKYDHRHIMRRKIRRCYR